MAFYLTTTADARREIADLPPKNRVRGFSAIPTHRAGRFTAQTLAPHRENRTTPTKTASGLTCWLARDPIGEEGGPNLYCAVLNDPVGLVDPLGLTYNWGTWYFTRPKSSSITLAEMNAAATRTINLFREFDMTIKFFDVALNADRTPKGLFNWFSYDLVSAADIGNIDGVLNFLHGYTISGHKLNEVIHVFNTYNSDTAGYVPNNGPGLPKGGRVAIFLDGSGKDPTGISRILFHEFVKHKMLAILDRQQRYDHIGLLANSLQEVQEEKVTCDVAEEMRKNGANVPKDKEFSQ